MGKNANGNLIILNNAMVVNAVAASRLSLVVLIYVKNTNIGLIIGALNMINEKPMAVVYANVVNASSSLSRKRCTSLPNGTSHA